MAWLEFLLPASFRGLSFGVDSDIAAAGRRLAVHEYPYRDTVWPEDLGKGPRRHSIQGFLVGDDVAARRRQWLTVAETQGAATLVHPSLGVITVTLLTLSTAERKDLGRVVELQMEFIEGSEVQFPSISLATGPAALLSAAAAIAGVASSYAKIVRPAVVYGSVVIGAIQSTLTSFGALAGFLAGDAGQAASIGAGLPGNLGRYGAGKRLDLIPAGATVQTLLAAQTTSQAVVAEAVATLPASAEDNAPEAVPAALAALVGAIRASSNDPSDQVRVAASLSMFAARTPAGGTGLGDAMHDAAAATAALCRRFVVIGMAQDAAAYRPGSYDEAVALRDQVTAALDAEITAAGDLGEDDAYFSLRDLRTSIAQDLTTRAAQLARLRVFTAASPLPALMLAQMIYRDGARSDDLIRRVNPRHPAFMPVEFRALAL